MTWIRGYMLCVVVVGLALVIACGDGNDKSQAISDESPIASIAAEPTVEELRMEELSPPEGFRLAKAERSDIARDVAGFTNVPGFRVSFDHELASIDVGASIYETEDAAKTFWQAALDDVPAASPAGSPIGDEVYTERVSSTVYLVMFRRGNVVGIIQSDASIALAAVVIEDASYALARELDSHIVTARGN